TTVEAPRHAAGTARRGGTTGHAGGPRRRKDEAGAPRAPGRIGAPGRADQLLPGLHQGPQRPTSGAGIGKTQGGEGTARPGGPGRAVGQGGQGEGRGAREGGEGAQVAAGP